MEVCVPLDTSACHDISDNSESSTDSRSPTQFNSSNFSVNEIEACFTSFLNIEDIDIPNRGVNLSTATNGIGNVVKEAKCKDSGNNKSCNSVCEKSLGKSATFPPPREVKATIDGFLSGKETNGRDITAAVSNANASSAGSVNQGPSRSISLPTPSKLVSAMKGSREKQVLPPKNFSVTWAPDVYDPIPTSVSHFPSYKNQRYRKRSGKNKQKRGGKSSRASNGDKDKKQSRKNICGGSSKSKPLHDDNSAMVGFNEPKVGSVDFNVGSSSDAFCGSSFLKKSVTKLHFPVAEAT